MSGIDTKGMVFNIQKFSTEDGPGIRTTVFMKGCPLRCLWCHNPESISIDPQLVWHPERCIGDGACVKVCGEGAIERGPAGLTIHRKSCTMCGRCAEECPAGALEIIGKEMTVGEVMEDALKDRIFYRNSGGGITLSGGEPTFQGDFLHSLLDASKKEDIQTALDTCGYSPWKVFDQILPYVDLVLFDLKTLDDGAHRQFTGVSIDPILENLKRIDAAGIPIWIRTPVIPVYTDSSDNIRRISEFISSKLKRVERYDLLAFSNLCRAKYEQLGMNFPCRDSELVSRDRMMELKSIAENIGIDKTVISGPMREGSKS